jgi:hypothetical protein
MLDASATKTDVFLSRGTCVFQQSGIDLFVKKRGFVHLETSDLLEVFHSKMNTILTGKVCVRCCSF